MDRGGIWVGRGLKVDLEEGPGVAGATVDGGRRVPAGAGSGGATVRVPEREKKDFAREAREAGAGAGAAGVRAGMNRRFSGRRWKCFFTRKTSLSRC